MKYFNDWNMKQRIFILNALLCLVLSVWAVPAKRGVWCSLSLVDGTEVKAQLVGDEFLHYYVSEDGTKCALAAIMEMGFVQLVIPHTRRHSAAGSLSKI